MRRIYLKPFTLSIDIGGTGLKASVLDGRGIAITSHVRLETPYPCPPRVMLAALGKLARALPSFDRVSVGFPGVVREGRVITAPHFGNKIWRGFPLAKALRKKLGKPVRLLNDADMQGLAVIKGKGLELVVTLGYGVGTAVYRNGELMPRLELAQHPVLGAKTYNEFIGDRVLKKIGKPAWNRRLRQALAWLETLLNPDRVYIGGGNARLVRLKLPKHYRLVSNEAGVLGGIALWRQGEGSL
ncbi:MAG TPA: ROK family protein [bacterium]|nr:ROK family protein [bacterium]